MAQTLNTQDNKGVVVETLKEQLCNKLIESRAVVGGEIVNHSYTNSKTRDTLEKYIESKNGIFPTMTTRPDVLGVVVKNNTKEDTTNLQNKIITHNISQIVKTRKFPVDTKKLKETLRVAKLNMNLNNKDIAEKLNLPKTQVEHWFRNDNSFAIPLPEIWLRLKEILEIKTNEFDESIMEFEEKKGVYDKANRVYDENGLSPTLMQSGSLGIVVKNKRLQETLEKNRNKLQDNSFINSYNRQVDNSGLSGTITTGVSFRNETHIINDLRIRKLTPKECWRLMGFDDSDFEKAEKVNSNAQLYKQAGNSIVVNVLERILENLFLKDQNDFEGQISFDIFNFKG